MKFKIIFCGLMLLIGVVAKGQFFVSTTINCAELVSLVNSTVKIGNVSFPPNSNYQTSCKETTDSDGNKKSVVVILVADEKVQPLEVEGSTVDVTVTNATSGQSYSYPNATVSSASG